MPPHSLSGLLAFLTVAERRSFSAAGRALGVSASALSQSVRGLEARVGTPLLVRTTRSVNLTEAGRQLLEQSGPGVREALAAIEQASTLGTQVVGQLRLSVPRIAVPLVQPVLPRLLRAHPRLSVEVSVEDRLVDIVAAGYDAGIRLSESIERDMVSVRICPPFRFVVVGSPEYLARRGRPRHPRELVGHTCINYRAPTSGRLYAWEFERRGREFQIAVQGQLATNDGALLVGSALAGLGLSYVAEPAVAEHLAAGRLEEVLSDYVPGVPGFFLYFPHRAQRGPKLRALLEEMKRGL